MGNKSFIIKGPVAQRLEQRTHNPLVPGSNPGGPTNNYFDLKHTRLRLLNVVTKENLSNVPWARPSVIFVFVGSGTHGRPWAAGISRRNSAPKICALAYLLFRPL